MSKNPEIVKTIDTKDGKYLIQMDSFKCKGS